MPATAVWKGDAAIACIAAASVLAKVTRDAIMTELHESWPDYEFAQHKGYITPQHAEALTRLGPCPEHRRRYVNVRRAQREFYAAGDAGGIVAGDNEIGPVGEDRMMVDERICEDAI